MVDVPDRKTAGPGPLSPELGLSVSASRGAQAVVRHGAFARDAIHSPTQGAEWIAAWASETGADIIAIEITRDGRLMLSLALEIEGRRGFKEATFPGGSHANGNFPALAAGLAGVSPDILLQMAGQAVRSVAPEADVIRLERLQPTIAELNNPLIGPSSQPSRNIALAADLNGGFDAFLERHSAKRKRKKHRQDGRKFEDMGGWRVFTAETPEQTHAMLDAFFVMKAARFAQMGIEDVFAAPETRRFFSQLFGTSAGASRPANVLHGLEVGSELRAVTASTICGDRLICEFSGFVPDPETSVSPGDFLFHEVIAWAAAKGFSVFDFSVGDEPYKRMWCSIETTQFDTLVPLNARGQAAALALGAVAGATRLIKANPVLWNTVKKLRKLRT